VSCRRHSFFLFSRIHLASSRIGMRRGRPTIRQFIWIWESLQRPFGSIALSFTFRGIQWPSPSPSLSLSLSLVLFFVLFLSLRFALSLPWRGSFHWASARFYPAFRDCRHLSWMDRQSSFTPAPLRALTSRRLSRNTPSPVPVRPLDGRLRRV